MRYIVPILVFVLAHVKSFYIHRPQTMRKSFIFMRSLPKLESPFTHAKGLNLRMPSVILVETFSDANIGSVSRIMLNFGLSDLRLVRPTANHLSEEARRLAVGSSDLLESATVYSSLKEAIQDLQVTLATTSRARSVNYQTYHPPEAAKICITPQSYYEDDSGKNSCFKSGIVFGTEKNGLSNSDLQLTNGVININTFDSYPVLNLAQAVNCIGYEFWQRKISLDALDTSSVANTISSEKDPLAPQGELDYFLARLESALFERGFSAVTRNNNAVVVSEAEEREAQFSGLLRIFKRGVTRKELQMLNGMLSTLIK